MMEKSNKVAADRPARPETTDIYVGLRVAMRRRILDISAAELASAAGLEVEQLLAHEAGYERISAARLYKFSQYLSVPVSWFFDGMGPEAEAVFGGREASNESAVATIRNKDGLELLGYYYASIIDPVRKRALIAVARTLAEEDVDSHHG
ncbi:MAG: transcriptional regulator with XRE-family HTH domain [Gammaproteobacteria bacterium]|jgi:transcriptional regulator with XRE-family HTH domain